MAIKRVTTEYEIYSGGLTVILKKDKDGIFIEQEVGYADQPGKFDRVYVETTDVDDLIDVLVEIQNGHE